MWGSLEDLLVLKGELNYVSIMRGVQFAITHGVPMMEMWYADNWDTSLQVCNCMLLVQGMHFCCELYFIGHWLKVVDKMLQQVKLYRIYMGNEIPIPSGLCMCSILAIWKPT